MLDFPDSSAYGDYAGAPSMDYVPDPASGSYSTSVPDSANNATLFPGASGTLSQLLNFALAKDKLASQTQLATRYPYGINASTGLPNTAPASAANLSKLLLVGGLVFLGLHVAKAV